MKKLSWILTVAMCVAISAPVLAGGKGEKCSADAQTCLTYLSAKKGKGWMGVEMDKNKDGAMAIKKVVPGSPAEVAGFAIGDVIVARNGIKADDYEAQKADKASWNAGSKVTYTVLRGDATKDVKVTLAPLPEDVFAQMVGGHMISDHMSFATVAVTASDKAEKPAAVEKAAIKAASADKK